MAYRSYLAMLIFCFFTVSCGTAPQQSGSPLTAKNVKLYSSDGSDFVVMTGPAPDGEMARIVVPSGQGFTSATLKAVDTDEPLKVSVNKWLNKVCETNAIEYVDSELQVSPVLNDIGKFEMVPADISMVNEKLKTGGFNLKVFSSEEGLDCSK